MAIDGTKGLRKPFCSRESFGSIHSPEQPKFDQVEQSQAYPAPDCEWMSFSGDSEYSRQTGILQNSHLSLLKD